MEIIENEENAVNENESAVEATETTETTETTSAIGEVANAVDENAEEEVLEDDLPPELRNTGKRMDDKPRWYVLHTFSGYEAVAEDNLKKVVEKYKLQERIFEIFIPSEEVLTTKGDKQVIVNQKTMPSYIFIKMIYGDDLWHTITRTRGITGFVGPKGRPLPLTMREVADMKLERKVHVDLRLEAGDTVQITSGPLAGQTAKVSSINKGTGKIFAQVFILGRNQSVELHPSQVMQIV
ncbi:MAG: KOW motif-containing protein [Christensenellaceae bacterium]|jgi:transcriptional antiterminator NusG|nr:KOW motif-containing protein [Christensenellaceae bacterium]